MPVVRRPAAMPEVRRPAVVPEVRRPAVVPEVRRSAVVPEVRRSAAMSEVQRPRRKGGRVLALAAVVAGGVLGLSACATQGGQALAQQACVHVHRSVAAYERSTRVGTPATDVAQLQKQAAQELRLALPLAAAANSDDGSWNSLMTTISESSWVDEGHLVPALSAQCVVADANQNANPQEPGENGGSGGGGGHATTTVPQNVNPNPASSG